MPLLEVRNLKLEFGPAASALRAVDDVSFSLEAGETPLPERFRVSRTTAHLVNQTRRSGRRVVAVGTTVTRALETATDRHGLVRPAAGWTELVLGPDRPARVVTTPPAVIWRTELSPESETRSSPALPAAIPHGLLNLAALPAIVVTKPAGDTLRSRWFSESATKRFRDLSMASADGTRERVGGRIPGQS